MKRTEQILVLLAVLAVILNMALVPGGVAFTLLTLALLSCLYFNFSFALLNGIRFRKLFKKESYQGVSTLQIIGAIGAGFALSILLVGIMFKLLRWPGASINLMTGLLLTIIVTIVCVIRYFINTSVFCKRVLTRTVVAAVAGIILLMIPSQAIVHFKYRNYPAYLEAFDNYQEHPDDVELLRHMDEERRKMEEGN